MPDEPLKRVDGLCSEREGTKCQVRMKTENRESHSNSQFAFRSLLLLKGEFHINQVSTDRHECWTRVHPVNEDITEEVIETVPTAEKNMQESTIVNSRQNTPVNEVDGRHRVFNFSMPGLIVLRDAKLSVGTYDKPV